MLGNTCVKMERICASFRNQRKDDRTENIEHCSQCCFRRLNVIGLRGPMHMNFCAGELELCENDCNSIE